MTGQLDVVEIRMAPVVDFLRGKRVVVTGALGFLGSSVVEELSRTGCEIVRVARRAAPPLARAIDVSGDVRSPETWERALEGADVVFHLAAMTGALTPAHDRAADFEANVRPMMHCLDICSRSARPPGVVFAGSVTQAGGHAATIYDEHKLAAERLLDHARRSDRIGATTLRLSNIYGPGPSSRDPGRGVLNEMIRRALSGEALTVYGSGEFVRDYLFVSDAARAFLAAARELPRLDAASYIVGSGAGHTIAQAFALVAERAAASGARAVSVVHVDPPRPLTDLDRRSFVADTTEFRAATGWHPLWSLCAGIDRTIQEMRCASS